MSQPMRHLSDWNAWEVWNAGDFFRLFNTQVENMHTIEYTKVAKFYARYNILIRNLTHEMNIVSSFNLKN